MVKCNCRRCQLAAVAAQNEPTCDVCGSILPDFKSPCEGCGTCTTCY